LWANGYSPVRLFCSFRRQHDQLRLGINRVLRPAISQEAIGLDVADTNAIEVN